MIGPDEQISEARKVEIRRRVKEYVRKHDDISQAVLAKQCNVSRGTVSDVLRGVYGARRDKKACDDSEYLRRFNNWMELDARRRNILQNKKCVAHSVAREIITVAELVSETCMMGVVYGPARIGKTFTLQALENSDRLGNPVMFRMGASKATPKAVCELMCDKLGLPVLGSLASLTRRLVKHLAGTRRMLIFDEADACSYRILEWIREIHDDTGCPVLLAGKPKIRQRLGFRDLGSFREVTDQLSNRIFVKRDLTERTRRTNNPEPLYSKDDIRQLIKVANLELKVSRSAVDWLQDRSCVIGMGGFGMVAVYLYLAYKVAEATGATEITTAHLDSVQQTTLGHEDASEVEMILSEPKVKQIHKLA